MSNVLDEQQRQQILGLGRVGWTVRKIATTTGVDRFTVRGYLRAAGIPVRGRGRPGEEPANPTISVEVSTDSPSAKPTITGEVSTDSARRRPTRAPSASACEPYRELIVEALGRGRNAVAIWQDLVDDHGFTARYASVRRFVLKLRGTAPIEARVVITTAPGEDYGEPSIMESCGGDRGLPTRFVVAAGRSLRIIDYSDSNHVRSP